MLSQTEFEEYKRKSKEDEYYLTKIEKMNMIEYIDFVNRSNPNLFKGKGIFRLMAFGPECWNAGLHNYKSKDQGGKKCWSCDWYHC
jgi:hypothetical protein